MRDFLRYLLQIIKQALAATLTTLGALSEDATA